ncbi:hypothetical protein HII12_001184 [Brettanomyces bruxellensis]|uniref:Amino acid permease/ SLC12A domain-containing protein n=1 Tax=Dekkera bruxellensis TaxID=5007 RepID=A0A8H6EYG4_DEKBR|nr:hypothetical protein HII12_001184 [Brettanomyces bruxellensis]
MEKAGESSSESSDPVRQIAQTKSGKNVEIEYNIAEEDERTTSNQSSYCDSMIEQKGGLRRGLSSRHVQLISLGGAIGTGLFVGSGAALATAGPAPLLIGYVILCGFVWSVMNQLAEMVTFLPLPGRSTPFALCARFTGNRSLAFAAGLNLVYAQALLSPAEISAASFIIDYWTDINPAIFISVFWVLIVVLNMCAVKYFGETEFWIAFIKILTIVGLIILGIVIFFGGGPAQHHVLGFHYWKDPGAFAEHLTGGATGRFIYRLIFFYICGALVIGVIVPYNSDRLMLAINQGKSGAAASPFVIGIENSGIQLGSLINACILTSAFSAGNSFLYGASRNLHSMAVRGSVPKVFTRCNRWGVPYLCVSVCGAISLLAFLTVSNSSTVAFTWLSNISTVSGFISWIIISITYLRYRKALKYHNLDDRVTFRPPLQIVGAYACIIFFTIITFTNGYAVFFDFNGSDFVAAYITIPIVFILYVGHAICTKNWRLWAPSEEIDCITGLKEIEEEQESYVPKKPRNFLERIWFWIA